jgi:hypothetical protein
MNKMDIQTRAARLRLLSDVRRDLLDYYHSEDWEHVNRLRQSWFCNHMRFICSIVCIEALDEEIIYNTFYADCRGYIEAKAREEGLALRIN